MSPDASVVIATYNRAALLGACLDCLLAQDYPAERYEIIVVDDGSTDYTESVVRERAGVRYLRQERTLGPGAARNRGIAEARGDIVIFTDSDALAPPCFVREHVETHGRHPRCIVDGPAITVRPPKAGWVRSPLVRMLALLDFWGQEFVTVNASCAKAELVKAGGFDERFLKWQDLELGQRLRAMGVGRIRNRRAYVVHREAGRRSLPGLARHVRLNGKYAAMFFEKHPSPWAARKTRLRYLAYDRMLAWTERYSSRESVHWFPLFRRLYLIHIYAEGLRSGLGLMAGGPHHD